MSETLKTMDERFDELEKTFEKEGVTFLDIQCWLSARHNKTLCDSDVLMNMKDRLHDEVGAEGWDVDWDLECS
ncbi:hypothetical protein [Roseivirga spongicola]|uniref:Uncharacterized protein n=1 Tax=Roseivirga spongicola TaxID=333140 RepID=A0A150XCF2_9BACT|nr:hypothetical protein [Roseivirga spongicola]KYG76403.1 hypothetical protein AWW68_19345 [Roseivirga spongicola]WPZ08720.1 hypothetical protein T7867_10670 [Roseivirga spongicola]